MCRSALFITSQFNTGERKRKLNDVPVKSVRLGNFVRFFKNRLVGYNFQYTHNRRKEGNVLFNDALNTFYLRLYGVTLMVKDYSDSERGNPLPPHPLAARVLLYASSYRQDNTYHGVCYTSRGALAGTRNSSMGPP